MSRPLGDDAPAAGLIPATVAREDLRSAWRAACVDTRAAYASWCRAGTAQARDAYMVFVAADDREAAAATALESAEALLV